MRTELTLKFTLKEGSRAERSYSTDDGGGKNSVGKGAMAEAMELGMS